MTERLREQIAVSRWLATLALWCGAAVAAAAYDPLAVPRALPGDGQTRNPNHCASISALVSAVDASGSTSIQHGCPVAP